MVELTFGYAWISVSMEECLGILTEIEGYLWRARGWAYCIFLVFMFVKIVFICPALIHVKLIINSFGIHLVMVTSINIATCHGGPDCCVSFLK